MRAVSPRIGAAADDKLDLAEFEFYKRNLAAIVKSPLVVGKALEPMQTGTGVIQVLVTLQ